MSGPISRALSEVLAEANRAAADKMGLDREAMPLDADPPYAHLGDDGWITLDGKFSAEALHQAIVIASALANQEK